MIKICVKKTITHNHLDTQTAISECLNCLGINVLNNRLLCHWLPLTHDSCVPWGHCHGDKRSAWVTILSMIKIDVIWGKNL